MIQAPHELRRTFISYSPFLLTSSCFCFPMLHRLLKLKVIGIRQKPYVEIYTIFLETHSNINSNTDSNLDIISKLHFFSVVKFFVRTDPSKFDSSVGILDILCFDINDF